ncbi:MAG: hypothetical protein LBQ95_08360 [Lachnospiraceae bacterium]|nr:hypothetical protein [Lachnospiraceae bacterium]
MGTFDRCFMAVLLFAVVNFLWIIFLEEYLNIYFGVGLGVLVGAAFIAFGPKKVKKEKKAKAEKKE